ncbi:hypothetical protein R3P38DRAFT_2768803 [Favolaschia claudopus]|uniref:Uncharacterized protein n=1 Tax=Favolaschia claudopus TaxID=2862362 RepID=A0AAW0CR60_9AGAR
MVNYVGFTIINAIIQLRLQPWIITSLPLAAACGEGFMLQLGVNFRHVPSAFNVQHFRRKFDVDINKYKVNELKQLSAALSLTVTGSNGKKTPVKDEFLAAIKEQVFKSSKNVLEVDPRFGGLYEGKKRHYHCYFQEIGRIRRTVEAIPQGAKGTLLTRLPRR